MKSDALTPLEYLNQVPEDQKPYVKKIREIIVDHLPEGFKEQMGYGMLGYVVPFELYPSGYHCDTSLPLPFMNLAAQKNSINLYHSAIYALDELKEWFVQQYIELVGKKPDMGKSCIRFKKYKQIPYELIAELVEKVTVNQWIELYERTIKR